MLPLAVLALLAMAVPASVAGWGPREAVGAWAAGLAGLSPAQGVSAAVTYGLMVLVASLPGAVLLLGARLGARRAGTAAADVAVRAARRGAAPWIGASGEAWRGGGAHG
jgi:hypothetical protein